MAKRFRLKKMINWTIQGPIVGRLLVHFIAYNAATLFLLMTIYGYRGCLAAISEKPAAMGPMTFWQQAAPVIICMLVMMPFMIWDLMKLTNRIAGPLFRFETLMKEFTRSGTIKPATIRDGDLLTGYQVHFNDFVYSLHMRHPDTKPVSSIDEKQSVARVEDQILVPFRQSM